MSKVLETEVIEEGTIVLKPVKALDLTEGVDLDKLMEEYAEVPEIDPEAENAGELYQYVLKGHKEFVKARNKIEKVRKALKAPALEFGKEVDSKAKELANKIHDKELELFKQRKLVEDNEQRKQDEAERVERERVQGIRSLMDAMQGLPYAGIGAKADTVKELIESMEIPSEDVYEEFTNEAIGYYKTVMAQLEVLFETATKAENADRIAEEEARKRAEEDAKREEEQRAEREAFEREKAEFEAEKRARAEAEAMEQAQREAEELEAEEAEAVTNAMAEVNTVKAEVAGQIRDAYSVGGIDEVVSRILDNKIDNLRWSI